MFIAFCFIVAIDYKFYDFKSIHHWSEFGGGGRKCPPCPLEKSLPLCICKLFRFDKYLQTGSVPSNSSNVYSVVFVLHLLQINPQASLDKVCLLGCGVSTGYGAALNTAKVSGCNLASHGVRHEITSFFCWNCPSINVMLRLGSGGDFQKLFDKFPTPLGLQNLYCLICLLQMALSWEQLQVINLHHYTT